jgi:uncharacterized membrane protein
VSTVTFAAVDAYSISVWLHITAVVIGFGSTFALALAFPAAMQLDPRHLPYVHEIALAINQRLAGPAFLVILATGIFQTADGDWELGKFWISGTIVILLAIGALAGGYLARADRKLGAMARRDIEASGDGEVVLSEEYRRGARTEGIVGGIVGLLIVAAIFLMVTKPGA